MGILASTDPVAIDRACIDMIKKYTDVGTDEWLEQSDNLLGENTIKVAEELGIGSQDYNLIDVDGNSGNYVKHFNIYSCILFYILFWMF